ncbi:MAG: GNAT family N-acetyltransferase [Spirochaetota bacterium]
MKLTIRQANVSDTDNIYSILITYSVEGTIIERTRVDIKKNIDKFFIADIKNNIAGVISYYHYSDKLIEVRSLAVKKEYYKKGIGSALLNKLINSLLTDFPKAKIFALSYHPLFFKKSGFIEVIKDSLPEKIWKDCKKCENQHNCGETALLFSMPK